MIPHLLIFALMLGDDAEAKRLFEAGGQAYEKGRYTMAIDAFEASHKIAARAVTAFSAAQAHRLQYFVDGDVHHLERAVELYRSYLELAPDGNRRDHAAEHLSTLVPILERLRKEHAADSAASPSAPARTQVIVSSRTAGAIVRVDAGATEPAPASFVVAPGRHRIEVSAPEYLPQSVETMAVEGSVVALNVSLEAQPGLLEVRAPAGASLSVDGQVVGTAPLGHAVEVRAGRHSIALAARGSRPWVREIEMGRGQTLALDARLERTAQRWASYGLFAGGGALLVSTAALWALALQKQGEAEGYAARMSLTVAEDAQYNAWRAERDDLFRAGVATGAIGVAAGAIGLVLWLYDRPEVPTPVVAPIIGDHLTGLSVSGQF